MGFIIFVKLEEEDTSFNAARKKLESMQPYMWEVSTQGGSGGRLEHVEFTIRYSAWEPHIHQRLEREKRCGTVTKIDDNTSRFSADIFDASEIIPWIRTFICRITEIHISNQRFLNWLTKEMRWNGY